ncbi:MAG: hypothetical protein DHS20C01_09970 [marine bacterium B5-7]|nr:MAG: hypothetical protein DHS20C01_09970 [marine bacterium B5-7]
MTFSIVARCKQTGQFGVAVSSSSPAVAARCAFARAGVGAVSSQNITDPSLGPQCLDLMELGADAQTALEVVTNSNDDIEYRQLGAVDANGISAIFSGENTLGTYATASAADVACAGNLLANARVPTEMVNAFNATSGHLGDRLLKALKAGLDAGGEAGDIHSAGLMVVDRMSWPVVDLRVDFDDAPIERLHELWQIYKPQIDDYIIRAIDPAASPGYNVAGDDR